DHMAQPVCKFKVGKDLIMMETRASIPLHRLFVFSGHQDVLDSAGQGAMCGRCSKSSAKAA
ncbi:hypothetical protein ACC792_37130, partial [Rhizobium ruizarguesonis]